MTAIGQFVRYSTGRRSSINDRSIPIPRLSDHVQELSSPHIPFSDSSLDSPPTHVPTSPPAPPPPDNLESGPAHELHKDEKSKTATSISPSPTQEHIRASPPTPPDKLLSDHLHELSTYDQQRVNATNTPCSSTPEHIPASQSSPGLPSHFLTRPDKLHPTLSCWIKNMSKLSRLVDRLQELASSAPPEHRSQLLRQVTALRAMSKKQKDHFVEFLQISEEYANKYLLDISAEIKQQNSFLDKLEGLLEAAKRLHRDAVDLQRLYESGTVATMESLRATALSRPLPEDRALFTEVDMLLTEIRQCYMELNKFWTEEISRAIEARKMRRVDPTDYERWKNFHANLKQTIESWKNKPLSDDFQSLRRKNACSSKGADIGTITSSLSSAMGSLALALDRLTLSNSVKYSRSGRTPIQRVYVAFAANSDVCLSFILRCVDYGEKVIGRRPPSIALPTPLPTLRPVASHDLRERTMRLQSEVSGDSMDGVAGIQGSRKFKAACKKVLCLEQKTTSGLNTLLEQLSSWVMAIDGRDFPDDAFPDVITLERFRERWVEARDSVSAALTTLTNEPVSLASTRPRSVIKRWLMDRRY